MRQQSGLIREELGSGLSIGGASGVEEQARIVRSRGGFGVDAQAFAEPHREQRAVQAMLEWQPQGEICRQT